MSTARRSILSSLGIVGWEHLEPIVVAALATESPLLLVGAHGSAKTLVLTRLAEALALEHRHYNASLLNFDDLVGFPVPENGKLVYLQTPATIWNAESVLFDEISRCRPDMQNKLFPVVHEKRVQGVSLDRLKHRWAAMNPPPGDNSQPDDVQYAGAEPLDVALADRFAFIVPVPSLAELSRDDQIRVLQRAGALDDSRAANAPLREALAAAAALMPGAERELREICAEYVQVLSATLAKAGHPLSTRRAVQLARNIVSLRAAFLALGVEKATPDGRASSALEDAFYCATRYSLPDIAWGHPVPSTKILTAHRAAWELLSSRSELKAILVETSPLKRLARALESDLEASKVGQILADTFSELDAPSRIVASAFLMPRIGKRKGIPAATIETIGHTYSGLVRSGEETVSVSRGGADWKRDVLSAWLPGIDRATKRGQILTNAAIVLMNANQQFTPSALERAYEDAEATLGAAAEGR